MLSGTDFAYVRDLVRTRSGLVLEDEKAYLVTSRLQQLARTAGLGTAADVVAGLRAGGNAKLGQQVVEAMTTNETSFFRDVHPFDTLRTVVLPDLVRRRATERKLTIWCGAASTGQEPYTLAITLREYFPALASWDVTFLATDLSTEVLARARAGLFTQLEVNRGLPAALLLKHFTKVGSDWQVKDDLRRMIDFRVLNLLDGRPNLVGIDLVFLRNVLIYFDTPTKKDILGRIRRWLRPDGCLFLGGAETTWGLDEGYDRVTQGKTTYYRPKSG